MAVGSGCRVMAIDSTAAFRGPGAGAWQGGTFPRPTLTAPYVCAPSKPHAAHCGGVSLGMGH